MTDIRSGVTRRDLLQVDDWRRRGCGMIASVRDGTLISMEGDFDHIVNRGSLCVKGISMFATHASPQRLTTRNATWVATEKVGDQEVPVNRTDAMAFPGGASSRRSFYLASRRCRKVRRHLRRLE